MRICTIIGARPQFVKAGVVSRALINEGVDEVVIHTGQHYDKVMSDLFFEQLGMSEPQINLGIGSASHAVQTGRMMIEIERFLLDTGPYDWMLVYGDTNSTIAAALVAAKCDTPLAHVEAGLRSFNRLMPEEINRVVTDSLSNILFAPTETAVGHLKREGVSGKVILSGDVMLDSTLHYAPRARESVDLELVCPRIPEEFCLATVHRAENTDDPSRLRAILDALEVLDRPVVFPVHPRTRKMIAGQTVGANVLQIEPVGYLEMLALLIQAECVLTDSGGLQKEAYWLGTPCITLREETEWVETLVNGWNRLVGADTSKILEAVSDIPNHDVSRPEFGKPHGRFAAGLIAESLVGRTAMKS